ncbi:MAG: FtsX-like permease family protein, partial [Rhodoferax sp.]|nr:FtsX-like permease family protein [Rhodoferax sp.]
KPVTVAGSVSAGGAPLAVMDIGAAQELFGRQGQLSRIDIRLRTGVDRAAFVRALQGAANWPPDVTVTKPGDAATRVSNLSRAYRVNLTVLALVALFTGAFLVFSVLSLSVAKRAQQFALLGVLGLTGRDRLGLVLWESLALGAVGSVAGIALGTGLAAVALQLLGGDLGGGYFAGVAPALQWNGWAALAYGTLGVLAALVGGWWPARQAQGLPLAQTLKGLGGGLVTRRNHWTSIILIAAGALFSRAPAIYDIPLAAYVSVALLLVGGITALPWLIALLLDQLAPLVARHALPLLAVERARRVRESASVAVSGVVASLSLAVALTVMVASFRDSVTQWL